MAQLSLVKSLSHLQQEQQFTQDHIEAGGLRLLRGSLSEIVGLPGSGSTAITLSLLADLTSQGEVCGIIDASDSFDPESAVLSGVILENVLWIKCGGNIEKAFTAADYLVQAKGFGAIWLNLNFVSLKQMRYIPASYWYRFRTGIKESPTILIATLRESILGSAATQSYQLERKETVWQGEGKFKLLKEIGSSLTSRKPLSFKPQLSTIMRLYEDV